MNRISILYKYIELSYAYSIDVVYIYTVICVIPILYFPYSATCLTKPIHRTGWFDIHKGLLDTSAVSEYRNWL